MPPAIISYPFPSREIFWPSGHTQPIRGVNGAGAAYFFQLEANGSTTYLTKVTAPDGAAVAMFSDTHFLSRATLAVGAPYADPGGF